MREPSSKFVRGITLIELTITIVSVSILCAESLPALGRLIQCGSCAVRWSRH